MLIELVTWWYGKGWLDALGKINQRIKAIWQMFSVTILLRTLFDPWKRIITPPGKSLDAMFRAMLDNLISRVVGFFTRLIVLIAALVVTALSVVIGGLLAIGWVFLMPAMFYFLVRAIIG